MNKFTEGFNSFLGSRWVLGGFVPPFAFVIHWGPSGTRGRALREFMGTHGARITWRRSRGRRRSRRRGRRRRTQEKPA